MPTNCPVDFGVSAVERKRVQALPEVLSEQEVRQLICQTKNHKHRALLKVLYTTGIRVGELVKLRPTDIDSKRMVVRVEMGKGRKSRYRSAALTSKHGFVDVLVEGIAYLRSAALTSKPG